MFKVENLCYAYHLNGDLDFSINDISFELQDNKVLCVVGASGSGKSTLAKLLAGLLVPQRGKILFNGENIFEIEKLYSKIGITLQNPEEQFFSNTIYDELAFGPKNSGYDTNEIDKLINNISDFFDISLETLSSFPFDLSLGNQRKCAIACATVLNPEILILDEPTAGLDSENKKNLVNFLNLYKNKHKCSVVLITHDMELVAEMADEVMVLQNGEKIVHDTPKNIFSEYESLETLGLQRPQINEIIQLVNLNKKYLSQEILTVYEAVREIALKSMNK